MLKLLFLIVAAVILEVMVWIGVAQFISGWWIFLATILSFVVGLNILRSSATSIMPQLQKMQAGGQIGSEPQVHSNLVKAFAGFLLLLPGLISDVLALLLFIPAVQAALQGLLMKTMLKRQQAMMQNMMQGMGMGGQSDMMAEMMRRMNEMNGQHSAGGNNPNGSNRRPTVVEGEARRVEPELKQIKRSNHDM